MCSYFYLKMSGVGKDVRVRGYKADRSWIGVGEDGVGLGVRTKAIIFIFKNFVY